MPSSDLGSNGNLSLPTHTLLIAFSVAVSGFVLAPEKDVGDRFADLLKVRRYFETFLSDV